MTGKFIECDYCKERENQRDGMVSYLPSNWMSLSKTTGQSGEIVPVGFYHFCSDKCLMDFLTVGLKSHNKEALKVCV